MFFSINKVRSDNMLCTLCCYKNKHSQIGKVFKFTVVNDFLYLKKFN